MNNTISLSVKCLFVLMLALGVLLNGLAFAQSSERIPITTVSKEALDSYLQGRDLAEKLRLHEARPYFEKALVFDPNFALSHLQLANVESSAKGFLENLNKAVELMPILSEGEKLWIEGLQAGVNGFIQKEEQLYKKLVEAYPNDPRAHYILGNFLLDQQRLQESIDTYKKATQLDPDFSPPYNQLGYANKYIGNTLEAEKAFKKYVKLIPGDPNPLDSYAELLMKMGKFDKSISNYKIALELNKKFFSSYIGIASNHIFKNEHNQARRQLQIMINAANDDGDRREAYLAMTLSYIDEGDMEQAIEQLNKQYALAERINDTQNMANDLVTMGIIFLDMGKFDKAVKRFNAAWKLIEKSDISTDVKNVHKRSSIYHLARVAIKRQEFPLAEEKIEEYITEVENLGNLNLIRRLNQLKGLLALEKEDYDGALEDLDQADLRNPYNLYLIAKAYAAKKNTAKAKEFSYRAAHFNELMSIHYALIRAKALKMLNEY